MHLGSQGLGFRVSAIEGLLAGALPLGFPDPWACWCLKEVGGVSRFMVYGFRVFYQA